MSSMTYRPRQALPSRASAFVLRRTPVVREPSNSKIDAGGDDGRLVWARIRWAMATLQAPKCPQESLLALRGGDVAKAEGMGRVSRDGGRQPPAAAASRRRLIVLAAITSRENGALAPEHVKDLARRPSAEGYHAGGRQLLQKLPLARAPNTVWKRPFRDNAEPLRSGELGRCRSSPLTQEVRLSRSHDRR
jgi:hypothetical protein